MSATSTAAAAMNASPKARAASDHGRLDRGRAAGASSDSRSADSNSPTL